MTDNSSNSSSSVRTLKLELLSNDSTSYIQCFPNAKDPTPFETEFFKGKAMLVVRTKPVDPNFTSFFMGKRQFEVQVQGKFKREPNGEIYVGAEASNKMELGILTRSISKAALKFCGTMVNDLHYSFGDPQDRSDFELPHLVAPIFPTLDKILVTPDGEPLPPMGTPFVEDLDYRKKRLKYRFIKDAQVDLNCTYSFSVNTSNLDLLSWTLVGIPMVRPMDLRTFFGNASIHLIAYEIPKSVATKYPSTHPQKLLNYVFSMKLTPVDPDELPPIELPISSDDDGENAPDYEEEDGVPEPEPNEFPLISASEHEEALEDHTQEVDRAFQPTDSKSSNYPDQKKSGVTGWFRKFSKKERSEKRSTEPEGESFNEIKESGEFIESSYEMESSGDLSFCQAIVEINDHKRDGRRRFYYILPIHEAIRVNDNHAPEVINFRLKTYSDICKSITMSALPKLHKNKKLSALEKRRRQIVESYKTSLKSADSLKQLKSFLLPVAEIDNNFLGGNITLYEKYENDNIVSWEGHVALALSRRHFSEHYMIVSREGIQLKRSMDSKKAAVVLKRESILSVQPLPTETCPFHDFTLLQIETYSRVYFLLLRSNIQINQWMEVFITILGNRCMHSPYRHQDPISKSELSRESLENEEIYYERPACLKADRRRIYNYRRIHFSATLPDKYRSMHPNNLIVSILNTAFLLTQAETTKTNESDWVRFWDEISFLQVVDLSQLNESEKTAFYLNLYHVMVLHGCLVFGPPTTWNHWNAYFNHICYLVNFESISIAEFEYCIIRASMSKASIFNTIAMAAPPQSQFPSIALTSKDFRFHFAINCGSISLTDSVPIYTSEYLDTQLDEITRLACEHFIEIDLTRKLVIMPKLPFSDYCPSSNQKVQSAYPSIDCLRALAPYLSKSKQVQLFQLLQDYQHLSIKFRSMNFRCRILKKLYV